MTLQLKTKSNYAEIDLDNTTIPDIAYQLRKNLRGFKVVRQFNMIRLVRQDMTASLLSYIALLEQAEKENTMHCILSIIMPSIDNQVDIKLQFSNGIYTPKYLASLANMTESTVKIDNWEIEFTYEKTLSITKHAKEKKNKMQLIFRKQGFKDLIIELITEQSDNKFEELSEMIGDPYKVTYFPYGYMIQNIPHDTLLRYLIISVDKIRIHIKLPKFINKDIKIYLKDNDREYNLYSLDSLLRLQDGQLTIENFNIESLEDSKYISITGEAKNGITNKKSK